MHLNLSEILWPLASLKNFLLGVMPAFIGDHGDSIALVMFIAYVQCNYMESAFTRPLVYGLCVFDFFRVMYYIIIYSMVSRALLLFILIVIIFSAFLFYSERHLTLSYTRDNAMIVRTAARIMQFQKYLLMIGVMLLIIGFLTDLKILMPNYFISYCELVFYGSSSAYWFMQFFCIVVRDLFSLDK